MNLESITHNYEGPRIDGLFAESDPPSNGEEKSDPPPNGGEKSDPPPNGSADRPSDPPPNGGGKAQ